MIKISKDSLNFIKDRIAFYGNESNKLIINIKKQKIEIINKLDFEDCCLCVTVPITQEGDITDKSLIVPIEFIKIINSCDEVIINLTQEKLKIDSFSLPYKENRTGDDYPDTTKHKQELLFTVSSDQVKKGINHVMIRKAEDCVNDRVLLYYKKDELNMINYTWEHCSEFKINNNYEATKEGDIYILSKFPINAFKGYDMSFEIIDGKLVISSKPEEMPLINDLEEDYRVKFIYNDYMGNLNYNFPKEVNICTVNRKTLLLKIRQASIISKKVKLIIKNGYCYIDAKNMKDQRYNEYINAEMLTEKENKIYDINIERLISVLSKIKDDNVTIGISNEKHICVSSSKMKETIFS